MFITLTSLLVTLAVAAPSQTSHVRNGMPFKIELESETLPGGFWGPESRTADHAAVAMNSDKDILVAYHTDRNDLNANLRPKQVEAVLFDYSVVNGVETWTKASTLLLGSTLHNPLTISNVTHVKCERPDVIVVGNLFLVVWTRIYEHTFLPPPFDKHPAVLECAWMDATGVPVVYDSGGASATGTGLGFILDDAYNVLECAGVPDAVVLDDGSGAMLPEVAVVYPTYYDSGPNLTRSFDLKIVTCQLDISIPTGPILSTLPVNLITSHVVFNGDDNMAAGLILPDLAPGTDRDQFLMVFEEQLLSGGSPYGVIRMHRIVRNPVAPIWTSAQSNTIGGPQVLLGRRRPNIASYPQNGNTVNNASIAFNTYTFPLPNLDANVVYSEWNFDPDNGISKVPWPVPYGQPPLGWPNSGVVYDFRPIPLHGADIGLRRCYGESFPGSPPPPSSGCDLVEYNLYSNPPTLLSLTQAPLGRPAVGYLHDPGSIGAPDYITLTWEQRFQVSPEKWRIMLFVR